MNRPGLRDYGSIRMTHHAVERFVERFGVEPTRAEEQLREALSRTHRLGRNPENGAIAVLAVHESRVLIAIVQGSSCLTVVTWDQFQPLLADFGRPRIPRKWGRFLRRLREDAPFESDDTEGKPEPDRDQ